MDGLTACTWSWYDQAAATDANLLEALSIDYPNYDTPAWVVVTELGLTASEAGITTDEFTTVMV